MYLNETENDLFLVEHASVLQERLGKCLQDAYPDEGEILDVVVNHFDPVVLREQLLGMFTPKALAALFSTEMGKGVIIGSFIQKHIFQEGE